MNYAQDFPGCPSRALVTHHHHVTLLAHLSLERESFVFPSKIIRHRLLPKGAEYLAVCITRSPERFLKWYPVTDVQELSYCLGLVCAVLSL